MFFQLTGAVYLAGAGAVVIGGLYWKRGTTAAAWTAMLTGSVLALGGILVQHFWPDHLIPVLLERFPDSVWLKAHAAKFPLNGTQMGFAAALVSSGCYILISLLGPRSDFDMDRLLHRGKYAVAQDVVVGNARLSRRRNLGQILGLTHEFSRVDKVFFWASFYWTMGWWLLFVVVTVLNLAWKMPDQYWCAIWAFKVWLSVVLGVGMTVWFLYGGLRDARQLFKDLQQIKPDESDDGTVTRPRKEMSADE
jgi:SSS family solute:Na+ symporter